MRAAKADPLRVRRRGLATAGRLLGGPSLLGSVLWLMIAVVSAML